MPGCSAEKLDVEDYIVRNPESGDYGRKRASRTSLTPTLRKTEVLEREEERHDAEGCYESEDEATASTSRVPVD